MEAPDQIPDIEKILAPVAEPPGLSLMEIVGIVAGCLAALALAFFIFRWVRGLREGRKAFRVRKNPREVALDVLHDLKENHLEIPAHEVAAKVHPVFMGYVESRLADGSRKVPPEIHEQIAPMLEECENLRFSRTPEADSRRSPLVESMLAFVREDPFPVIDDQSDSHSAAA